MPRRGRGKRLGAMTPPTKILFLENAYQTREEVKVVAKA